MRSKKVDLRQSTLLPRWKESIDVKHDKPVDVAAHGG